MAQTAVEFLIEQLKGYEYDGNDFIFTGIISSELIEQAKQMEMEQAFQSFKAGQDSMEEGGKNFEQYYKETFGNK